MPIDSLIDSLVGFGARLRIISKKRSSKHNNQTSTSDGTRRSGHGSGNLLDDHRLPPPGFFNNANRFIVNNPIMAGTVNMLSNGDSVMHYLIPHMNPDAAVNSSARWPPPSCHPGTRVTICNKLTLWLDDLARQWCFIWLYGSAGCGKSAVAQTFAEKCDELGRLGAAFFFSRPNKRNDPKAVIPTIAYQLATHCSDYKAVITSRLADDPQLLSKSIHVQFKKLIIEPFTYLHNHRYESVQRPYLIVLDGLDECEGEAAQCEFVKLVNEVVRVKKDLPLLWLICSRPEAHLQHTFTRIIECGREELAIDEECRDDVDRYLRDGFFDLREKYNLDVSWPSQDKFDVVSKGGSGHFVFAATALGFIGDEDCANPVERLDELVGYLSKAERDGVTSPLAKLDFLYISILSDIPASIFSTTWRILAHYMYAYVVGANEAGFLLESAQALCNLIDIDQNTFYGALRKLYSVIAVPTPEQAATRPLRFYHASFQDFLLDGDRSGGFAIEREQALVDITKTLLFWQGVDSAHFHTAADAYENTRPWDSTWAEVDFRHGWQRLSENIATFSCCCWISCRHSRCDERLIPCVHQLDQRYLYLDISWPVFVNVDNEYFLRGFYRTQPCDEFDAQLLDYLRMMTSQESVEPAEFPLTWNMTSEGRYREYILVGNGAMSVVVWFTHRDIADWRIDRLSCDLAPSPDQIFEYQEWLQKVGWYSEDGKEFHEHEDDKDGTVTPGFWDSDVDDTSEDSFGNVDSKDGVAQSVDHPSHNTSTHQGDHFPIPCPSTPYPSNPNSPLPTTPHHPLLFHLPSHQIQSSHGLPTNQRAEQPHPSPAMLESPLQSKTVIFLGAAGAQQDLAKATESQVPKRVEKRKADLPPVEHAKRQRHPPSEITEGQSC